MIKQITVTDLDGVSYDVSYTEDDRLNGVSYEDHIEWVKENLLAGDTINGELS